MVHPTRHLCGDKPHRYVSAARTDIRRTFRRARLLARLRQAEPAGAAVPALPRRLVD
jgi:hypothetical protein